MIGTCDRGARSVFLERNFRNCGPAGKTDVPVHSSNRAVFVGLTSLAASDDRVANPGSRNKLTIG